MTLKASLSSKERIKSKVVIDNLFKKGKTKFAHPLKMYYTIQSSDSATLDLKFGISVPKSLHKKAVTRNRLKRVVREAYRLRKPSFIEPNQTKAMSLNVFFIYIDKEGKEDKIVSAIDILMKKLEVALTQFDPAATK